jgi:hypothetical protein
MEMDYNQISLKFYIFRRGKVPYYESDTNKGAIAVKVQINHVISKAEEETMCDKISGNGKKHIQT